MPYAAGVALGGCPLVTGLSLWTDMNALYVRAKPKDHGTSKQIEGDFQPGASAVLVEDVVTTGGSSLEAIDILVKAGLKVVAVVAVLDREQGGAERIRARRPFHALFTLKELLTKEEAKP